MTKALKFFEQKPNAPSRNTVALIIGVLVVGSALVVLNMDDIYLSNKNKATVSVPDQLLSGAGGSLILQASDEDGEPAADRDVKVTLTRGGEFYPLYEGKTNDDGVCQPSFEVPDIVGEGEITVTIGSESVTQTVELVSSYSIIISTDKPLYQPGQTIHIRTLAYQGKNPQASEENITLVVKDPDGNKIFRKVLPANDFGIASYDFALSDQLPLGNYKIVASIGETESERTVSVQRYVLPKYRIQFEDIDSWYVINDVIEGTLNASYTFGEPIVGDVVIDARTYYGEWESIASFEGELVDGLFNFSLPLATQYFVGLDINSGNAYLELNATITDTSGHVEEKSLMVTITESPISLMSIGDTNIHGQESTYHFIARYPDGTPASGAVLTIDINGYNIKETGSLHEIITADERGVAPFNFIYDRNITSIEVVAKNGDHESLSYFVNLREGEEEGIKIISDKSSYDLGDTASCDVFYSGTGGTNMVFYDILAEGFVVRSGHIELTDGSGTIEFSVSNEMTPMVECRVYKIRSDFTISSDSVILTVGRQEDLNVDITTDEDTYRPGDDVPVTFKVTDGQGTGVLSALGITIVDLSVYELQERFTGYEDIYFSLQAEFTDPQYQILEYVYGTGNVLPSETTTHVDASEADLGITVYQSGGIHKQDAGDLEETTTENVIDFIMVLGVLGYISLFAVAGKYKLGRRSVLSMVVILALILPAGFLTLHLMDDDESLDDGGFHAVTDEPEDAGFQGGFWEDRWMWDDIAMDGGFPEANGGFGGDKDAGAIPPSAPGGQGQQKTVTEPDHIRKEFPETWVWEPSLITNEQGLATLGLIAPDTITTWRIDALASTKDARMGQGTGNITVFQEFFVEPDIPVEVVRNDEFPLSIMIYNYHSEPQEITVKLDNASWFDLLAGDPVDDDNPDQPDDPDDYFQVITVDPASVAGIGYTIKAKEVGTFNVTLTASSDLMADKVIREMSIVPDGQLNQHIINGEISDNMTIDELVRLAADRIPNSENAYLKLQGSMEAVTVEGAEQYIRFVSGCGEQSMSALSIDILAYMIVKETAASEKLFEYETIITQGIQHELTFLMNAKNGEGRGIVWFPSDEDVHPWLTSWGLLTFQDAIDAGFEIDDSIITDMQQYLISQQNDDGSFSFPERGLYEFTNPILRSKVVSTTAYITRALLYSGYEKDSHIDDAVGYIEANIKESENWEDPYTISIVLTVLEDAEGSRSLRDEAADRLLELKEEDNGTYYWTSVNNMISNSEPMFWGRGGGSSANTIETTSYAVMALSKHGNTDAATRAVKYLLTHRIGGGYFSTQDTVVAFQALTRWGSVSINEMTIDISMNGNAVDSLTINEENSDLTYLFDLRPWLDGTSGDGEVSENDIRLVSTGEGTLLYQIVFEEFLPWEAPADDGDLTLDVSYDSTNISVNDAIEATLTVGYTGSAPQIKMVLVDIRAPVGFSFDDVEFEEMVEEGKISHFERTGRQCQLYISDLVSGTEYEYTYSLTAQKPIRATIQGVNVHDMYNPVLKDVDEPVQVVCYEG